MTHIEENYEAAVTAIKEALSQLNALGPFEADAARREQAIDALHVAHEAIRDYIDEAEE